MVFDQLFETFLVKNVSAQRLLFPMEIGISAKEAMIWSENEKTISRLRFEWDIQKDVLELLSVPALLSADEIPVTVEAVRDKLADEHFEKSELAHILIEAIAVSSSRTKKWSTTSAQSLLELWYSSKDKLQTPNGNKIVKAWNPLDLLK